MDLPQAEGLKPILERWARLLARSGPDLGERPLVLPNAEFFPDRFTKDPASAGRLVERMLGHAGMTDVPLAVRVVSEEGPEAPHEGGCASGCQVPAALAGEVPRLVDDGDGWILQIPAFELEHAVVLTTMIARALGHVFLMETLPDGGRIEAPADLTADYAAVALGLGPLLLEGAHIYTKSCGGPSVSQVTRAGLAELALTTALFAETTRQPLRRALSLLSTTQTAALSDAHAFVKERTGLVALLREDPERVAHGDYSLEADTPWLLRVFGRKSASEEERLLTRLAPTPPPKPRAPDPVRDELRALVDEAFAEDPAE
ncbi:MAG TPA: hypothetical protein VHE30_18050 [Polyangiaceae bacterium]|nr:hypothetical protein [Polyangiaceae bacterium]